MSKELSVNKTQKALEAVNAKLKALKVITDSNAKTNGEFRFNPAYTGNAPIRIYTLTKVSALLSILGYLTAKNNEYNAAAELAKLEQYPAFTWLDYTYDDWKHDLLQRIAIVNSHKTKKRLEKAKAQLQEFLTKEDRLAIFLKENGLEDL